jgi:ATPase involved in DNA repair
MLQIEVKNIRSLDDFTLTLPFQAGLHAIAGENGVGKSTIFSCLSKFVYRGALRSYFRSDGNATSRITYSNNGQVNSWIKQPNWKRDDQGDPEILLDGFYEGSLIFGSRFADAHLSKLGKSHNIKSEDLVKASDFVVKNLGRILRNNENHYSSLMKIKTKTKAEELGFNGNPYFIERNGKWVSQLFMSSGELLLIGLLHFINERIELKKKRNITDQLSLILVDEIELALHASAQQRLAGFLNNIASVSNFCIYFATHSVQIINTLKPDNIFYINRAIDKSIDIVNPCYPAYATRSLYSNDGYDLIILVEDDLARFIVEKAIREENLSQSRMIKVLPCGGWEKTLELQLEMKTSLMLGQGCDLISILDGDIESECLKKYGQGTREATLKKLFLPIHSVEKFLKKKLIDEPCVDFAKKFGDRFFIARSIEDIINDYSTSPKTGSDNSGKNLFRVLTACAEDQGHTRERFKSELCSFLTENTEVSSLKSKLSQAVA